MSGVVRISVPCPGCGKILVGRVCEYEPSLAEISCECGVMGTMIREEVGAEE